MKHITTTEEQDLSIICQFAANATKLRVITRSDELPHRIAIQCLARLGSRLVRGVLVRSHATEESKSQPGDVVTEMPGMMDALAQAGRKGHATHVSCCLQQQLM